MERWLKEAVGPDLKAWGFNTVGWTQEVVTRGPTNHRHSRAFTFEEYQWLDMPYCHQLPFADFHQWDAEVPHANFAASEWADWCDYVARENCARMRDDPKLIGYFYIDCPTWIDTRPENEWKGPLFDPEKLKTDTGRKELLDLATAYYRTTHKAIRRYDPHHLILGDRYEAGQPIADEVIAAALPFVDVLSFQHLAPPGKVAANPTHWHERTGKPTLLADHAAVINQPDGSARHDGEGYATTLETLTSLPGCVGYHLCGAYEASIRVPLIMHCPDLLPAGRVVQEMAANIDIAPTILAAVGVRAERQFHGRNLLPLAKGEHVDNWRTEMLYEYFWERWAPSTPTLHALLTPRWKYVRAYGLWDVAELYDLESDPHELHNLFTAPEHHARAMQMDKRLFELLSETGGDSIPLHRGWNGSAKEERNARQSPWAEFPKSMTVEE
ncbi:MAG: DUF4976 domain-containing protein [Planctomycetaceae bacterium]